MVGEAASASTSQTTTQVLKKQNIFALLVQKYKYWCLQRDSRGGGRGAYPHSLEYKTTNTDADNETVEAEAEEPIHILSSTKLQILTQTTRQ